MKKFFKAAPLYQDEGVGLIRMLTGALLIYHGWEVFDPVKMKEYAAWDFFKNNSHASFMVYLGKGSELVSGILLASGFCTRVACFMIIFTFMYISFVLGTGKIWYEDQYPFLFVLLALLFFFTGPGKWSIDRALFSKH